MSSSCRYCVSFFLLIMLSGCSKIIDWGQDAFYQGTDVTFAKDLIERYIQMISVYDEGTTCAKFDVLWLGDEVRTEYARFHTRIAGKNEEQYQALLRRQLEENKHFITFYVLSLYEITLGDLESEWHITLRVDGKEYVPTEIKVIELAPEYKTFLGEHFSRFRVPYRVIFDVRMIDDELVLKKETEMIEMFFRSTKKEVSIKWNIDENNKVFIPAKPICEKKTVSCSRRHKRNKV